MVLLYYYIFITKNKIKKIVITNNKNNGQHYYLLNILSLSLSLHDRYNASPFICTLNSTFTLLWDEVQLIIFTLDVKTVYWSNVFKVKHLLNNKLLAQSLRARTWDQGYKYRSSNLRAQLLNNLSMNYTPDILFCRYLLLYLVRLRKNV